MLWHRNANPHHIFASEFSHAPFTCPCRDRRGLAGLVAPMRTAADGPRAGRRARMPRRRQHRLRGRLRHQSRLRAARRGPARRPLHRDHPQGRPRSRHHPGDRAGLGRVRAGRAARRRAISPALMPARRAAPRSASASAAMCWSAAPTIPSRCSRSACKVRSASTSPPVWKAWNSARDVNARQLILCLSP